MKPGEVIWSKMDAVLCNLNYYHHHHHHHKWFHWLFFHEVFYPYERHQLVIQSSERLQDLLDEKKKMSLMTTAVVMRMVEKCSQMLPIDFLFHPPAFLHQHTNHWSFLPHLSSCRVLPLLSQLNYPVLLKNQLNQLKLHV